MTTHDNRIKVDARRSSAKNREYLKDSFDVLASVHLETKGVAYIPFTMLEDQRFFTLWLTDDYKNNNYHSNYTAMKFRDYSIFPVKGE